MLITLFKSILYLKTTQLLLEQTKYSLVALSIPQCLSHYVRITHIFIIFVFTVNTNFHVFLTTIHKFTLFFIHESKPTLQ